MLRPTLRARRSGLLAVPVIVILVLALSASPAAAIIADPTYGPHSGNVGVHTLIDSFEFGTVCTYGSNHHLKKIRIRRPIVFAYDRTNHEDTEKVGWRYHIEYGDVVASGGPYQDLPDWDASSVMKANATDDVNAPFLPQTYTFTSNPTGHSLYRVSIQMIWYYPSSTHKDGQAVHVVYNYRLKDPQYGTGYAVGSCPSVATMLPKA